MHFHGVDSNCWYTGPMAIVPFGLPFIDSKTDRIHVHEDRSQTTDRRAEPVCCKSVISLKASAVTATSVVQAVRSDKICVRAADRRRKPHAKSF